MKLANLHLVTGYAGYEHVTAADQGAFNVAMLGSGQFVIDNGNKLAASVVTNNTIRVTDGDIYMQGRYIRLNEGTFVDLTIDNGAQGKKRNDLIVARYTKDAMSGVEEVNLVVIKGTDATGTSNPVDPAYNSGNIIDGKASLNDMPLYRVPIDGLNVQTLVPLFTLKNISIPHTAADMGAAPAEHTHTAADVGAATVGHTHTAAEVGAAVTVTYTATVTTTWTASGEHFYQDIAMNGVLATDNPVVDIVPGSDNAANALYAEAICKVFRITTSANSIRVWAKESINTAFPIQLKVVR